MHRSRPLIVPFIVFSLVKFSILFLEVPTIRIFEKAICNRFYSVERDDSHKIRDGILWNGGSLGTDSECKLPAVQDLLADVTGWKMSFDAIPGISFFSSVVAEPRFFGIFLQSREADLCVPGLLTAISYGAIAEQRNRRQLLLLSCVGMFLALLWMVIVCM